jgi:hypothetical protein
VIAQPAPDARLRRLGPFEDRRPCGRRRIRTGDALRQRQPQPLHEDPIDADLVAAVAAVGEVVEVRRRAQVEPTEAEQLQDFAP